MRIRQSGLTRPELAELMCMSERTLSRRLKDPDTLSIAELRVLFNALPADSQTGQEER